MLFAAIPSICASSSKKISIYNEEMIVARRFIGFIVFSRKSLGDTFKVILDERIEAIFSMNNHSMVLYGDPTPSDLLFMQSTPIYFPSRSASSTLSSNSSKSDAQSAPPELDELFNQICDKCEELVLLSNRQVPPEWNMADLIRAVMGNEAIQIPGYLKDIYYDILLRGATSWLFEALGNFIDLIH